MLRLLKISVVLLSFLLLVVVGGYFVLITVLKNNGITFSEKDYDFPSSLKIRDLQIIQPGLMASFGDVEINLSLANAIRGRIYGDYLIVKDGEIASSTVQTNDTSETIFFKDMIPISFKKIEIFNLVFTNIDHGDTLLLAIPDLHITNIHLGDKWHIDSLSNIKSKLEWSSHSAPVKQEQKTDSAQTKSFLSYIPEFTINNLNFIDCDFLLKTPSQQHSIKKFNLELVPQKENKLFTMAINQFSLTYQDTLDIDLSLNKILVNDKEDIQLTNLDFDFPWLKLQIPQLDITNIKSPRVNVQFRESYFNTALIKLFVPAKQFPLTNDLGVNFDGAVSYYSGRIGFEKLALNLSKNSNILLDGFTDLPGKSGAAMQLKVLNLNTSTTELAQLFDFQSMDNQKQIIIHSAFGLSGFYDNLQAKGSLSLNKMATNFRATIDQRNKNTMKIGLLLNSRFVDVNQWVDSLGTEIQFTDFMISCNAILDSRNELSTLTAQVTSDSLFVSSHRMGEPTINLRITPAQASVKINLPELLTLTLNSPDNIRGDLVRYSGSIESTLPQLANLDSSAGDFFSQFNGVYSKDENDMEFKMVFEKILFEPASYQEVYESSGVLVAGQNSEGDLHLNLTLDGAQLIDFRTTAAIYDWWELKNKWRGNFPESELELAITVDSLLIKQFTGQSGLIQLNSLLVNASGNDISANIDIPVFFMNGYDFREVNGKFEFQQSDYNGMVTVKQIQNPYAILQDVELGAGQKDEFTAGVSFNAFLPEVQNNIEVNCLISSFDTSYVINLDRDFLKWGENSWQNLNSQGFIFNKKFDLLSGDLAVVNGIQKVNIRTYENIISLKVDSLLLDPIGIIAINDSSFHAKLNVEGNYNIQDEAFALTGSFDDIMVNSKFLGALHFEGKKDEVELKAKLLLEENYGKVDFSILKQSEPYLYNLNVENLDLTFLNTGTPWEELIPITGKVNAKLDGIYEDELKSKGFVSFDNVETVLTENKIYLKADRDTLWFKDVDIIAKNFEIYDKSNQALVLDGKFSVTSEPVIDMTIKTKKFRILDASNNTKTIKGIVDVSSDVSVKRSPDYFKIKGNLSILPQSTIKYLFESTVTLDERDREVSFVSFEEIDNQRTDTVAAYRFTNRTKPIEWDVKLDVGKSTIEIVLNETYQDNIKMVADGNFLLKTGTNDEPYFFGTLKSNEGSIAYDAPMVSDINLKIENVLVKWNGELAKPRITFQGYETFRVAPKGIPGMSNSTTVVPVDVVVKVQDKPIEAFDLKFDLNSSNAKVKSWVQSLPEDTREANAINLMLFGTLNFGETAGDPSLIQSLASKMNEISRRNIKNADLSFYSANQDVSSTKTESKEKLGYNFSKGIANQHMKISIGGALDFNHDQDPNQKKSSAIPNIQLDYILSESPDINLSAAQQNVYDGVINGQLAESSFGITYLKRFRNIFKSFKTQISE